MTFYDYMMQNYLNTNSPSGDLANDMQTDFDNFPRNKLNSLKTWHTKIRKYLENHSACDACLRVFEECWKEYEKSINV